MSGKASIACAVTFQHQNAAPAAMLSAERRRRARQKIRRHKASSDQHDKRDWRQPEPPSHCIISTLNRAISTRIFARRRSIGDITRVARIHIVDHRLSPAAFHRNIKVALSRALERPIERCWGAAGVSVVRERMLAILRRDGDASSI